MNYESILLYFLNTAYDIYPEEYNGRDCISVKIQIGDKEVILTHICVSEFTCLPVFLLRDAGEYGRLAHVQILDNGSLGAICVNDSEAVSVNFQRPELALEESLRRHIKLLKRVMCDPVWNRKELLREFKSEWDRIAPGTDHKLVCSAQSGVLEEMEILQPAKEQNYGIYRCLVGISESNSDLNCLSYLKGEQKRQKANGPGYIIPLESLEPAPLDGQSLPAWFLDAIGRIPGKLKDQFQRKLAQFRANQFYLVFNAPTPSGVTWFGLHLSSRKKGVLPQKKERLGLWEFKRLPVDVLNKELIMPRSGANPTLDKKKVLLIGCGSVGSELALKLGSAGVGELNVSDPDTYSLSNIYRHTLNKRFVDVPKSIGLSMMLSISYPWISAFPEKGKLLSFKDCPDLINHMDLIIIAIGSPTHERLFHEYLVTNKTKTPVINTWLEGHGIGGHATLDIPGSRGCLGCAYIENETGRPGLSSNLNFFEPNQSIVKNYAGCGETFIPYGAIHSTQTALIAADLAISYLEGKITTSQKVSWKGQSDGAVANCIKLSDRYNIFRESLVPEPLYNPLCKKCRGEPVITYTGGKYTIHVARDLVDSWDGYRQITQEAVESAGLLIGHRENDKEIWLDGITRPKATDINKRNYFKLDDRAHQEDIDSVFAESAQHRGYLGTWHTHPQDHPGPSPVDTEDWIKHNEQNTDRPLFFIIIGRKSIKAFMLEKGPLTELTEIS
ncbi:MAG: ThiF family adenylyltransferase [Desulfobacter sp.]